VVTEAVVTEAVVTEAALGEAALGELEDEFSLLEHPATRAAAMATAATIR